MEGGGDSRILALLLPHPEGAVMRLIEKTEDTAQYVIGAPLFAIVAGLTALVMAIGFPVVEAVERLRHHG
jgi:hypothetical protein